VNVIDLAVATHQLLERAGLPHAFGGALALNLYAEPRMTHDVDVSVFVPWAEREAVIARFEEIGFRPDASEEAWVPIAGVRLVTEGAREYLDLFFALDPLYDRVRDRAVSVTIGRNGETLPFFTAEDVAVFKLSFNRPKDWVDLQSMIDTGTQIDLAYVEEMLVGMRGPTMHPRLARFRRMAEGGTGRRGPG
jgi:hypothetical protein